MRSLTPIVAAAVLLAAALPARAEKRAAWNRARTAIYTEENGVRRLGGTVDGVTMVQIALDTVGGAPMVDFVRSRSNEGGAPLRWTSSCVFITPDAAGSSHVPGDEEIAALDRALAEWESETASCGYLDFERDEPSAHEVGFDGVNLIKFREDRWCRPATDDEPEECYSANAAALTTLFYIDKPGEPDDGIILDADIEMNGVDFAIAVGCETECQSDGDPSNSLSDLENTMMHELGHLIGLDHTCWEGSATTAPLDDQGEPVPLCSDQLSAEAIDSTMYNYQGAGEVKKRSLEPDDIAGMCGIYPKAQDPGSCNRVDIDGGSGWCGVAPPAGAGTRFPAWVLAAGLVALAGLARKRRS